MKVKSLVEDMARLLPCPFCGKMPLIVCPDNSYGSAMITCGDDNECLVDLTAWGDLKTGETIADAVKAWNTRAVLKDRLPVDDRELVERLRRAADSADTIVENTVRIAKQVGVDVEAITGTLVGRPSFDGSQAIRQAADRITAYSASSLESGADPAFVLRIEPLFGVSTKGFNPGERKK